MRRSTLLLLLLQGASAVFAQAPADPLPYVVVLGIAQDGGYPQAGTKESPAWDDPTLRRLASCLALVDPAAGRRWLFEATPDFREQLHRLDVVAPHPAIPGLEGVFLTHGHMGHYAGLIHLGQEAIGAKKVPVWAMPRMERFLRTNGPWDLLVRLENIVIRPLVASRPVELGAGLSVTPLVVPHRDEYTETVAFIIRGPRKAVLFLPDIDKWERLDEAGGRIEDLIAQVDVAYLDGTFYADGEIPGRNMAEIKHPFIEESLARFAKLPEAERRKVRFIHLNRSNPALDEHGTAVAAIAAAGFSVARELERVDL
ncbi:MAG: pyrroloquinoline quinone biosynthesis protein PqqB [Thermoanaerobaculia bacterium]|nr:pyrroloquinoline quinone biosynthesis protein PqqB [Thermoanaerobaculia bacterium]